ncbi:hypothetical protein H0H81_008575 [Sphagnurus paluster]|uniref:Uncharacterized protein n=1 Tax=Sphagnurus paluster TaxID=117069 RepID=A0A9P7GPQ9_9AGAR|nr:hypothetical protein H0H81_008575 [Sphagnurus paluster]
MSNEGLFLKPTPLPPAPSSFLPSTVLYNAYERCLNYEAETVETTSTQNPDQLRPLIAARILGYLLLHAPMEEGRIFLSEEIMACLDARAMFDLARVYNDNLIRICE